MGSIKLWGIVLPKMTNILGKPAQTLRVDSTDKPLVRRLEFDEGRGIVVVELAPKPTLPEMPDAPNTVLLPKEQVAVMVPMPKKQDKKYELFADDDDPTPAEQLAKANARAKAFREAEEAKAKLEKERATRREELAPKPKSILRKASATDIGKPKKRGRPKKKG